MKLFSRVLRDFSSEDDEERRKSGSSDELFEPYPGKR